MTRTKVAARFSALVVSASLLAAAIPARAESIPPNCILDPFTHKLECFEWPKPKKAQSRAQTIAA